MLGDSGIPRQSSPFTSSGWSGVPGYAVNRARQAATSGNTSHTREKKLPRTSHSPTSMASDVSLKRPRNAPTSNRTEATMEQPAVRTVETSRTLDAQLPLLENTSSSAYWPLASSARPKAIAAGTMQLRLAWRKPSTLPFGRQDERSDQRYRLSGLRGTQHAISRDHAPSHSHHRGTIVAPGGIPGT